MKIKHISRILLIAQTLGLVSGTAVAQIYPIITGNNVVQDYAELNYTEY